MTDPLVSTDWLAARLGDAGVRVVDATWFLPGEGRSGREAFAASHIPGAVFFDIDEIADRTSPLPHMLPDPQTFAAAAGALGLAREATIVVYDAHGLFSAPRVWWTLRAMAYPSVAVLDGGLKRWLAEDRPIATGEASPTPVAVSPAFDPTLVRDLDALQRSLASGAEQVVDARPALRFRGEAPEPRPGLRSGHMPGARNIPWNAMVAETGTLKPPEALEQHLRQAGVDPDRPVVATCGSGVSAAVLALALARLGRNDIAIYDGSWAEWGAREDLPIATGS